MLPPTSKVKQEKVKLYSRNALFPGLKPGKVSKNCGSVVKSSQELLESSSKERFRKTQERRQQESSPGTISYSHLKTCGKKRGKRPAKLIGLVANFGPQAVG